jgi:hypothetical protein
VELDDIQLARLRRRARQAGLGDDLPWELLLVRLVLLDVDLDDDAGPPVTAGD